MGQRNEHTADLRKRGERHVHDTMRGREDPEIKAGVIEDFDEKLKNARKFEEFTAFDEGVERALKSYRG